MEHLATENLNADTLIALIKHVTDTRGMEVLEEALKVRLMLAGFTGAEEITDSTLEDLEKISMMLNQTQDAILFEKKGELLPPAELVTQIKTELVAQGWRNSVRFNARELLSLMRKYFGQQPQAHERKRFDELNKAATLPGIRKHIDRQLDNDNALNGLIRYALEAQAAMGPTVLQVINDDINSGNYVPGQALSETALAVQSPPGLPMPSPTRPTATSPQRNASLPTTQALNPLLQQAMGQLQRSGGEDPLQQATAQAQIILAAAALAGANGNDNNNNAGRSPLSTPARPTFPHKNARPVPEALRRDSFVAAPTPGPTRRRNKKWQEEEVQRLIESCRKHGPGAWAKIEADNSDIWGPAPGREFYRTQVDLKDKWRNLAGHKGEKANRNNAQAVAVDEMWKEKREREDGTGRPPSEAQAVRDAFFANDKEEGAAGTTTEVEERKQKIKKRARSQKYGGQEEEDEEVEGEAEEDDVEIEDVAQATEVQEQGDGEEEIDAYEDEDDDDDDDAETTRPAKKSKKGSGNGRKKVKKSAATKQ